MYPGIWMEFNNYLNIVVSHYRELNFIHREHMLMCATLYLVFFKEHFQGLQSQACSGVRETYAACANVP